MRRKNMPGKKAKGIEEAAKSEEVRAESVVQERREDPNDKYRKAEARKPFNGRH
jgi:hypothetical protein